MPTTTDIDAVHAESLVEPVQRLETLCDPGSFHPLLTGARSRRVGDRGEAGDGVVVGAGSVGGRPVFCYAQDPRFMGGSLGEAHADSIVRVMDLAAQARAPVVGFVSSGGARLQEGHAALAGYGRIFRASVELSKRAPQISIVSGVSAGGGAYSPALTDFVVMTERARMFDLSPRQVQRVVADMKVEYEETLNRLRRKPKETDGPGRARGLELLDAMKSKMDDMMDLLATHELGVRGTLGGALTKSEFDREYVELEAILELVPEPRGRGGS